MATAADKVDTAKADAAAEKAYAEAASEVSPKAPVVEAKKAETPVAAPPAPAATPKIDKAVAAVKAAPIKKAAKAKKPAAARKTTPKPTAPAAKSAPVKKVVKARKKVVAKAKPAAKPAAPKAAKIAKTPVITPVSKLKDKIMATAKTTDFTKTVKDMAADAQTKAKAAYDKMQAYAGDVTEFTKGNVEAIVESGKILGAGVQDMARGEVEAAKGAFETATADLKAMAAIKSPAELFKLQGEIARRNFDAAVAHYSKNAEVSMKLANEAFAPLSNRMSLAAEKISKAA